MHNEHLGTLEKMIFAAQALPEVSVELRRRTLARSVRAYHERAQRRRTLIAASLLFGFLWMAGSAQQLLAQSGLMLSGKNFAEETELKESMSDSLSDPTNEWHDVERARYSRSRLLKRVLGAPQRMKTEDDKAA